MRVGGGERGSKRTGVGGEGGESGSKAWDPDFGFGGTFSLLPRVRLMGVESMSHTKRKRETAQWKKSMLL